MEYKDINVRVYVTGEAQAKEITPASGTHAGEQTTVLNFRAVEPRYKKYPDGRRERQEGIFYSVRYFELNAKEMADLIKTACFWKAKERSTNANTRNRKARSVPTKLITPKRFPFPSNQAASKATFLKKRETKKPA